MVFFCEKDKAGSEVLLCFFLLRYDSPYNNSVIEINPKNKIPDSAVITHKLVNLYFV